MGVSKRKGRLILREDKLLLVINEWSRGYLDRKQQINVTDKEVQDEIRKRSKVVSGKALGKYVNKIQRQM